jgi:hypothetical protein
MYGKGAIAAGGPVGSAGALAYTGVNIAWMILGALMIIMAGVAVIKLVPKYHGKGK